ncbi:MAG: peptidoglycan editing factor PgeF [Alphaproteobacteria bacterium]
MTDKLEPIRATALSGQPGLQHGFFTRRGGVSEGLFASLNCGFGSGDDAARVAINRGRVADAAGVEKDALVTASQMHGGSVALVSRPWAKDDSPRADGMVTTEPDMALGILTADCAPVLFADAEAGVIGAAHGGWRGIKAGILEETVSAMIHLGARAESIGAAVGPCIGKDSYEVGPEFPGPFLEEDSGAFAFFRPGGRRGHFTFDLAGLVRRRLDRLGLGKVEVMGGDTCAEEDRFFSYRRATHRREADYGRNLSVIALAG